MFPREPDPKGGPETWTREEMRRWLAAVRVLLAPKTDHMVLTILAAEPFPQWRRHERGASSTSVGQHEGTKEVRDTINTVYVNHSIWKHASRALATV